MTAEISRIGLTEDPVTELEVEVTCQRYCKQVWGRDLASKAVVKMFMQALDYGGYRVVRK